MESPFTRPLPTIDTFPSSPSEIRVRVYNAVIKQPLIVAVDSFESTPESIEDSINFHTSDTDVNVSDAGDEEAQVQEAQTPDDTRDSIQILGPLPVQLMSVSLTSSSGPGSSSSSDIADEHSSRLDTTSLNRCKSLPDLRPLGPSATPPSSPILSVKSMVDVSPSFLCLDENAPTAFREDQAQRFEDVDEGVPDDHDNRDSSDAPEARLTQASTRPTLQPWVMESIRRMCTVRSPPGQSVVHRASKRPALPTIRSIPGSPSSPTEHIRKVKERHAVVGFPKSPDFWTDTESEGSASGRHCEGCGRKKTSSVWMRLIPCEHIICAQCFSASISGVTVTRGPSNCPRCFTATFSMEILGDVKSHIQSLLNPATEAPLKPTRDYPVLRIDNVAWDVTPQIVRDYLPPQVLPYRHPQPIHILLDRFDGRTKDYMYVEVANEEAVRRVLKYRQNSFMPCGPASSGRKRPVTITAVPLYELLNELRPRFAAELHGLLGLCHAAVDAPYFTHNASGFVIPPVGPAHFVKSRHGPFYAVMSILTKLHGPSSPSYWDTFNLASGAIKALSLARYYNAPHLDIDIRSIQEQDRIVLESLTRLYHQTFHTFKDD